MKILAIRGKNLASLAGEFAIELDRSPLGRAGLFAITGPTGAGKSTLLDALCLALFDEMPRLPRGLGVAVGRANEEESSRLRSNDVRGILRRGASEGHAEVDFVGNDGRRYRTRWELRRARGKATGKLQSQVLTLWDLHSGQALGRTKTEVLELIIERLGLSFEQFRRSALLAQGDFAAFLKADARQRSELLERITGTEIYSELSMAAHRRASEERQGLTALEQQLGHLKPLDGEARAELERQQIARQQVLTQADALRQTAQRAIDWYGRLEQLRAAEQEAGIGLERAEQVWREAEPRRHHLQRVQQAQPLRRLVEIHDRAWQEQQGVLQSLEKAQTEQALARRVAEDNQRAQLGADQALRVAAERLDNARPLLNQAYALDAQITHAGECLGQLEQEHGLAADKAKQAEQDVANYQAEYADSAKRLEEAATWLGENAHLAELAGQWQRWDDALQRYARTTAEAAKASKALHELGAKGAERQRRLTKTEDCHSLAYAALQQAQARLESLQDEAARYSLDELSHRRQELESRQERLQELHIQVEEAVRISEGLAQAQTALAEHSAQELQARQAAAAKSQELESKRHLLAEAERALHLAITAHKEDVASLRARLRDGEPCLVCGATEHPWAHDASPLNRLLTDQQLRVDTLKNQLDELAEARARLQASRDHAHEQSGELTIEIEKLQTALTAWQDRWARRPPGEQLPESPLAAGLGKVLMGRLGELKRDLADLADTERRARDCHQQINQAHAQVNERRTECDQLQRQLISLGQTMQELAAERSIQEAEWRRSERAKQDILDLLATPLAGVADWQEALATNPATCRMQYQAWANAFNEYRQAHSELSHSLKELDARLTGADTAVRYAREETARIAAALQGQSRLLDDLKRQRCSLFNDRPTAAVEQELIQAERDARQQAEQARQAVEGGKQTLAAAQQQIRHCHEELHRRRVDFERARTNLEQALSEHDWDLAALRECLQCGPGWLESERTVLEGLTNELQGARIRLTERARQRQAHQQDQAPPYTLDEAQAWLAQAELEAEAARQAWAAATAELTQDDRKRAQAQSLQAELDKQRQCWELWEGLRELIGSSDGAKFRTFAQSLTLDMLITHANHHLQDLARRYRLERAPGSDLELQVIDREMGDEARSVHSLSGGESFLVSLALALGLASLSSHRTQVESLFIDEGFGSLDPDALDVALASLDALQSQGRKVGVISHVPTLVERIGIQVRVEAQGGGRSVVRVLETNPFWV